MAEYRDAPELKELADHVIASTKELHHLEMGVKIAYLWCDSAKHNNGNIVYADTEKITDKHKQLSGYDFVITFYERNCKPLDNRRMAILMEHELLHVGVEYSDEGIIKKYIRPHDIGDFEQILTKYGLHWVTDPGRKEEEKAS